jgi:hypothetical protein
MYRRELAQSFDENLYHRRNLGETAFSVLKRGYEENAGPGKVPFQPPNFLHSIKN